MSKLIRTVKSYELQGFQFDLVTLQKDRTQYVEIYEIIANSESRGGASMPKREHYATFVAGDITYTKDFFNTSQLKGKGLPKRVETILGLDDKVK